MDHHLYIDFIGNRYNFLKEINKVRTKFIFINSIVSVKCGLELFECKAFFTSRQACNDVAL